MAGDRIELTADELAPLLREAQAAHSEYERTTGERDEDWPAWYAQYIVDRASGSRGDPGS